MRDTHPPFLRPRRCHGSCNRRLGSTPSRAVPRPNGLACLRLAVRALRLGANGFGATLTAFVAPIADTVLHNTINDHGSLQRFGFVGRNSASECRQVLPSGPTMQTLHRSYKDRRVDVG